jgi:hypothetical protein
MSGKHTNRIAESRGEDLVVQFSPEVTRLFSRLEAAVHDSEHFAPEIFEILQDMTERKPRTVRGAILSVAAIVKEAAEHVHATGDKRTREALEDLIQGLVPEKNSTYPITVTKIPAKEQGRAR